jgi:hypothetical protein
MGDAKLLRDFGDWRVLALEVKRRVRAVTFSAGIFASTFSSSSLMPSEKYSFAGSRPTFSNASTAMDFTPAADATGGLPCSPVALHSPRGVCSLPGILR